MAGDAPAHYVIIGSGLAGYGVARELRRAAPDASIAVITRDAGHFYSKPALSTALAKAKAPEGLITMAAEKMAASQRLTLLSHTAVDAIDRAIKCVRIGTEAIRYDKLILAIGATPVRLALGGDAGDAALSINTLDDYAAFRERLAPGASVAIMGAGLVGSEFANDLSQAGHPVTVIDPLDTPLAQLVPATIGAALREALAVQGVAWRLGTSVVAIDHRPGGFCLTLADGTVVSSDIVLSAAGLRPNIALAQAAGIMVDRGIVVDDQGRTSDPDILAIGDCAQYPHGLSAYVTPLMSAARAIAATASGTATAMRFPALSVQVKTSACPLVLLPPRADTPGRWVLAERSFDGEKYLFLSETLVRGYAMTGSFCEQRVELDRAIGYEGNMRDVA